MLQIQLQGKWMKAIFTDVLYLKPTVNYMLGNSQFNQRISVFMFSSYFNNAKYQTNSLSLSFYIKLKAVWFDND